jgi:hypothetical protein
MSKYNVGDEVVILLHEEPGTVSKVRSDDNGDPILEVTEHRDGQIFLCRECEVAPLEDYFDECERDPDEAQEWYDFDPDC